MKPLLSPGDRILYSRMLVDRQSRFIQGDESELSRGDLVIISPPYFRENQMIIDKINPVIRFFTFQKIQFSSYSRYSWETSYLIKRVVAIPGDTIRVTGHRASLKVAGEKNFVSEDQLLKGIYRVNINQNPDDWESGYPLDGSTQEYKLGEKEFFVLGDNRGVGSDSSIWGPLPKERIIGKVFFRYWPFSGFSFL
jgi:signal peptidase I